MRQHIKIPLHLAIKVKLKESKIKYKDFLFLIESGIGLQWKTAYWMRWHNQTEHNRKRLASSIRNSATKAKRVSRGFSSIHIIVVLWWQSLIDKKVRLIITWLLFQSITMKIAIVSIVVWLVCNEYEIIHSSSIMNHRPDQWRFTMDR